MNKKKTAKKDRPIAEGQTASRGQRFRRAVPAASLGMLALYVLVASEIMVFPRPFSPATWEGLRAFLLTLSIVLVLSVGLGLYVAAYQARMVQNHVRGAVFLGMLVLVLSDPAGGGAGSGRHI